jgi:hypothetical protein
LYRIAKDKCKLVISCPGANAEIIYRIHLKFCGGHGEGPHKFLKSKTVKKMLKLSGWELKKFLPTLLCPFNNLYLKKIEKYIINMKNSFINDFALRHFYVAIKM